jgi:ribonuclease E
VELTRKRQGQNIYELFGRACPSCGGLGHVAVLPGKDLSQPLAAETGLVRSVASARSEVVSPADTAANNNRRRRGGRSRTAAEGGSSFVELPTESEAPQVSTEEAHEPAIARRQDPELVAVPMTDEQQEVYSWLGLNPALLLDEPPESDNVVVRVVRPGEDEAEVLEEARQQLAASAGRRRRRGSRGAGGRSVVRADSAQPEPMPVSLKPEADRSQQREDDQPLMVEITPLESVSPATVVLDQEPVAEVVETTQPAEDVEEPRRRRRRSSAPSSS